MEKHRSKQLTREQLERFVGVVEIDESYFGPARLRGRPGPRKRGRGTLRQPVFGVFERDGGVYTEIVPDCSAASLYIRQSRLEEADELLESVLDRRLERHGADHPETLITKHNYASVCQERGEYEG